jgi:hypothetical protein
MKTTFFIALLSTAVSFAAADIVITPVFADQIVQKQPGDCFFGVVTPQGCAYVFSSLAQSSLFATFVRTRRSIACNS